MLADKLRKAVLQAAIQGKLTKQLPTDGNAADLVAEIKKEKERLIKEKKIKKQKPLPPITAEEIPFEIPDNWCWVRLGDIMIERGQKKPDEKFSYIDIGSINNRKNKLGEYKILLPEKAPSRARKLVKIGDIIYSTVRPYLLNTCIIDREIKPIPIVSTGFAVITTNNVDINKYIFKVLLSPMFNDYANDRENSKGVAYPAINDSRLKLAIIPFPPLIEQKCIVEIIEEILNQIEQLKTNEEKLSLLQKNFPDKLKKSLLQAAIQGKLTEQFSTDDNVDDLLAEIRKEKEKLIKEKKIKKQKPLPPITEEEIPFEIPENWRWVRLGCVIELLSGRDLLKDNYSDIEEGIPYITGASNFVDNHVIVNRWTKKPMCIALQNDILLTCKGTIGELAIFDKERAHIARQVMAIRVIKSDTKYFFYYVKSQIEKLKSLGKSIIPGINRENILWYIIPLPPLAEQQRIVEQLDQLLANVEDLKVE